MQCYSDVDQFEIDLRNIRYIEDGILYKSGCRKMFSFSTSSCNIQKEINTKKKERKKEYNIEKPIILEKKDYLL